MKKILFILFSLLLASCSSTNNKKVDCDYIEYSYNQDNLTASIVSGVNYNLSELKINSNVIYENKSYTVTSISVNAFKDNQYIEYVEMPNTIELIGYDAFRNCISLKEVILSEKVITLSDHLFAGCTSLKKIENTDNVENIYTGTFVNTGLETICFNHIKSIGQDAFFNNSYLKEVTLLGEYTTLSGSCFERCSSLKRVNISDNLEVINDYVFKDSSLEAFDFSNINYIGKYAFENTFITELNLQDITLNEGSFKECKKLENVVLSTEKVPESCFYGCTNLNNLNLSDCLTIGSKAFYNIGISTFMVCNTLNEILSSAFEESGLNNLIFEDNSSLKIISRKAFANTKLTGELRFPSSLNSIYNQAFYNVNLSRINISSDTRYDSNSFDGFVEIVKY